MAQGPAQWERRGEGGVKNIGIDFKQPIYMIFFSKTKNNSKTVRYEKTFFYFRDFSAY